MYLSATDLLAVMIALVASVTLIITSAIQNARLTKSRNDWRQSYLQMYSIMSDPRMTDCECESK
jgi:hypothetical protein